MFPSGLSSSLSLNREGARCPRRWGVPASPRDHRAVTLHFYLPSGEFIKEEVVPIWHSFANDYLGDDIPHQLVADGKVTLTSAFVPVWSTYVWDFVWNDMLLEHGMEFEHLVDDHGMSVDEPVVITVVSKEHSP